MKRIKIAITIDMELMVFAKEHAKRNYTSVSEIVRQHLLSLKKEWEVQNEATFNNRRSNQK